MKKKTIETKWEKVGIWGQLNLNGHFLVTVSSVIGWLYSKDPKIANEFLKVTNKLYPKLKKMKKEQEKELKEGLKPLKEIVKPEKKWGKFW